MGELVSFNNRLIASNEANIAAMSGAALYGSGVFTTIAVFGREPFAWEKHWRRLRDNCGRVGLDLSGLKESDVRTSLEDLLATSGVITGRARITMFDTAKSSFWSDGEESKTGVLIVTAARTPRPTPFRLGISPYRINSTSPLAGVKSCNYLEKHLAKSEAGERGFHEAVQLNERGVITSACMANVFWSKDGTLFTASLETGCLAGTTREFVIENLECAQVEAKIEDLRSAEEIFLTSAGIGVVQVDEFDGRSLSGATHPISKLLPLE